MPLRTFGGVSRTELLKSIWIPATGGTTRVTKGNHTAYRILNPGDEALCELMMPNIFTTPDLTLGCWLMYISNATLANMFVDIAVDYGLAGETYNFNTAAQTSNFATTINLLHGVGIVGLLANLTRYCRLGVRATYNAGPNATNIDVLGTIICWN